jgi:hypothetical protein
MRRADGFWNEKDKSGNRDFNFLQKKVFGLCRRVKVKVP